MSYDGAHDYLIFKVPEKVSFEYIKKTKDRVRFIDYDVAESLFRFARLKIPESFDPSKHVEEEDLFNLSSDDLDRVSKKAFAKIFLNEAIDEVLSPLMVSSYNQSTNLTRADLSYISIEGSIFIVTGGERKYTYSSPTSSYDYLIALNILNSM
tara:strand:+ start:923 stop:1381 length:459 start_codon:yes stop_codon:yes gene_type:complete